MARDSQRQKLYDSEHAVCRIFDRAAEGADTMQLFGSTIQIPLEVKFGDLGAVEQYYNLIRAKSWHAEHWPNAAPVTVRRRKGMAKAHYSRGEVAIPDADGATQTWALRELVALHEYAHHVTPRHLPGHGPEFARNLLTLLRHAMGPEAELLMMSVFIDHGVKW